jgi:hypothetical protein
MKILPSYAFLARTLYLRRVNSEVTSELPWRAAQFSRCVSLSTTRFLTWLNTFSTQQFSHMLDTESSRKILYLKCEETSRLEGGKLKAALEG